jgi:hypothetical protein
VKKAVLGDFTMTLKMSYVLIVLKVVLNALIWINAMHVINKKTIRMYKESAHQNQQMMNAILPAKNV